jgi:hypothetical protein
MMALTSRQTAAKAQMTSVSWSSTGAAVTWSEDCTLTNAQKASVVDLLVEGKKPVDVIADVLSGKISVEQRLTAGSL